MIFFNDCKHSDYIVKILEKYFVSIYLRCKYVFFDYIRYEPSYPSSDHLTMSLEYTNNTNEVRLELCNRLSIGGWIKAEYIHTQKYHSKYISLYREEEEIPSSIVTGPSYVMTYIPEDGCLLSFIDLHSGWQEEQLHQDNISIHYSAWISVCSDQYYIGPCSSYTLITSTLQQCPIGSMTHEIDAGNDVP